MFGPPHKRSRGLASRLLETVMVGLVRGVFGFARLIGPERSANVGAALARGVGPLLPAHKTALANIRAVYPEKSDADVKEAWTRLGFRHIGTGDPETLD